MSSNGHRGALEALDRIVNRGGDADDVLRAVVAALHEHLPHLERVSVAFVEGDARAEGPSAGESPHDVIAAYPVTFNGVEVAAIEVPGLLVRPEDRATLTRVATLISPYCLVGWDTGGEPWTP